MTYPISTTFAMTAAVAPAHVELPAVMPRSDVCARGSRVANYVLTFENSVFGREVGAYR